jgi:hypothetical protein
MRLPPATADTILPRLAERGDLFRGVRERPGGYSDFSNGRGFAGAGGGQTLLHG